MKASEEAKKQVRTAIQRLALSKVKVAYSRAPKRRWIELQKMDEAETELKKAEDFSRTIHMATAVLTHVETHLASNDYAFADSPPTIQRRNKRRRASITMEERAVMRLNAKWGWTISRIE